MPEQTPRSPPIETPVSPIICTTNFHQNLTSPVTPHGSVLDTSVQAINAQPVELDGIPTSPQEQELKRRETDGSRVLSPADEDIDAEFLNEGGKGAGQLGREVSA